MAPWKAYAANLVTIVRKSPQTSVPTTVPQAPPVSTRYAASSADGWSPSAIIGIVAAIVLLLLCVPLIAILLRRYERKRLRETPKESFSSHASLAESVREDQSLRSILVTRELQRSSFKLAEVVDRPASAHVQDRGWSQIKVQGGDWK